MKDSSARRRVVRLLSKKFRPLDSPWFSIISVVYVVCVGIVGNVVVGVRVCSTTVVVLVIAGKISSSLGVAELSFELTTLISVMAWPFAVVTSWFGFRRIWFCGLLRHSSHLQFFGASKQFSSNSLSRFETICSYVPISKCKWSIDFFSWGGIWHIWNALWSLEWQLRMRLLLNFWSSSKNQLTSGSLDWKLDVGICISPSPLTGVWRIFCGRQSGSLLNSLCWGWWSFYTSATHYQE